MDDEDDTIFEYPAEVVKAALAWVPRENLYAGIAETVDFMATPDEDSDEPLSVLKTLGVLFEASVMGRCYHETKPEEENDSTPPLSENDIQAFRRQLGLHDEE